MLVLVEVDFVESWLACYLEVELEYLIGGCVGMWALCELVLLDGRVTLRLEDVAEVLLLLPPATLANCSGVSSFLGSLMVFYLFIWFFCY